MELRVWCRGPVLAVLDVSAGQHRGDRRGGIGHRGDEFRVLP